MPDFEDLTDQLRSGRPSGGWANRTEHIMQATEEDLKALDKTIDRWKQIVNLGGSAKDWYGSGIPSCPLCILDRARIKRGDQKLDCSNCVIYKDTNDSYCHNTSYHEARLGNCEAQIEMLEYLEDLKRRLIRCYMG